MENQFQKWVNLSYLALAALFGYLIFWASLRITGTYDLEARIPNIDLIIRGVSLLFGGGLFFGLYSNSKANQFMNEVVTELTRVTWPTVKDTRSATIIVIVMVLISGIILGLLDYLWTALINWIL